MNAPLRLRPDLSQGPIRITPDELSPIASRADIDRLEGPPIADRIAAASTYDLLRQAAGLWPDRIAIRTLDLGLSTDAPRDVSYRALFARTTQAANLFHSLGLERQEAVTLLLPNLAETHFAVWGASAAGIANPVNPLLSAGHIAGIMKAARSRILVAPAPALDPELWEKIVLIRDLVPDLLAVITVGGPAPEACIDLEGGLDTQPLTLCAGLTEPCWQDTASSFHTGGTTGLPKIVKQTHFNQLSCTAMGMLGGDLGDGEVILTALPMFHVIAGVATGLITFASGSQLLMCGRNGFRNPFTIAEFWKTVSRFQVNSLAMVPTVVGALSQIPVNADISCLRAVTCGAAPLPPAVIAAFEARAGAPVIEAYGMTEATAICAMNPRGGTRHPGSVGFPVPYQQVRIVQTDEAGTYVRDCAPGEAGLVLLKGPNVILPSIDAGAEAGMALADGWLDTGDLGWLDAEGYLWLTGRAKDLIIRSGHNIDPRLIEDALYGHPDVLLAAAVGRPDSYAGEIPVAFVVLKPDAAVDAEALKAYARDHVSERPAAPAEILILDAMPLTAIGKIFKPALRGRLQTRATQALLAEAGLAPEAGFHAEADLIGPSGLTILIHGPLDQAPPAARDQLKRALDAMNISWRAADPVQSYQTPAEA